MGLRERREVMTSNNTARSVFCACGAQWHGVYIVRAQDTIRLHEARARPDPRGRRCALVSEAEFSRLGHRIRR